MSCDGDVSMGLYSAKRGRFWVVLGAKGKEEHAVSRDTHSNQSL